MNLNEIRLPLTVIADLYKKSLIDLPVLTSPKTLVSANETLPDSFKYMGGNLKQILILVHYPDHAFIPDEQLPFLIAVLKACGLTLEDTAIVNFARFKYDFSMLRQRTMPRVMLFFGISVELSIILEKLTEFELTEFEGIAAIYVPELERLNQSNNEGRILKKKLWSALKQLFHDNGD